MGVHQPLDIKDLDKPVVLKRGDAVTIVFDQPGLKLTAKGQSRENGSTGGTVRVMNIASNRTIFCRVLDAQTVLADH
jgi:flagella basal body P-ring formation protein FlgA